MSEKYLEKKRTDEYIITLSGALVVLMMPILFQIDEYLTIENQWLFMYGFLCLVFSFWIGTSRYINEIILLNDYSSFGVVILLSLGIGSIHFLSLEIIREKEPLLYWIFLWSFLVITSIYNVYLIIGVLKSWKKLYDIKKFFSNIPKDLKDKELDFYENLLNQIDEKSKIIDDPLFPKYFAAEYRQNGEALKTSILKILEGLN